MMWLVLSLAFAADGDEVGGFVMGQTAELDGLECRESSCQKRGEVAGTLGTWAVKHCSGVVTGATFSVTYVPNTEAAQAHFQAYGQHVADPESDAHVRQQAWIDALVSAGWQIHTEHQDDDGSEWVRVVKAPHARLVRVRHRAVNGLDTFTTSLTASATDPSCPRP